MDSGETYNSAVANGSDPQAGVSDDELSVSGIVEGDVVKLKPKTLKRSVARYLANTGHRFVVLEKNGDKLKIATVTSQLGTLEKFVHHIFRDWKSVPFTKECGVNLQSVGEVDISSIRKVVGKLSDYDFKQTIKMSAHGEKITQRLEHLLRRGSTR